MGLDMYAYSKAKKDDAEKDLAYWRKHPNLHGWMEELWHARNEPGLQHRDQDFNGIELELFEEDLADLEDAINNGHLPPTGGFFFGDNADEHYKQQDLEFVAHARADLFCGLRVFYNSSW